MTVTVPVRRLPHAADLPLPTYATAGSAGLDLPAAVPEDALAMGAGAGPAISVVMTLSLRI